MVEGALDLLGPRAREKGLDLAAVIDPDVPVGLRGDSTRIRQIILKLASNAVKFTSAGEVVVTVSRSASGDATWDNASTRSSEAPIGLEIRVRDTGIGISEDKLLSLFNAFTQVDGSTTRRYGGTGLGLVICQQLVALMGGLISVESEVGAGSTFICTVSLPVAPDGAARTRLQRPDLFEGRSIIVVDDNATIAEIFSRQAANWGMTVQTFNSGASALAALAASPLPDIFLLGFNMPDIDGVELAALARDLPPSPIPRSSWRRPSISLRCASLSVPMEPCLKLFS